MDEGGRSRRRRRTIIIVALLIVVGGAVLGWWWRRDQQRFGLRDPNVVALPALPDDPAPTKAYFEGPGAGVVALLDVAPMTRGEGSLDKKSCQGQAPALMAVGEPGALRDLAMASPDPSTAAIAAAYVDDLVVMLASCAGGEPIRQEDLAFSARVFERRLESLGVK